MKSLILNPFFLPLILSLAVLGILLSFVVTSRYPKIAALWEKVIAIVFIFQMPGLAIQPFSTLHPRTLYADGKTIPSIAVQIGLYLVVLFLLSPRLQKTLKHLVLVLSILLINNLPFCLFMLNLILSYFWSIQPDKTLKSGLVFFGITIVSGYIAWQYSWEEIAKILRWSFTILGVLNIYYAMVVPSVGVGFKGWQGIVGHPNPCGTTMAFMAGIWSLYAAQAENQKERIKGIGFTLLALHIINQANSAGAKVQFILMVSVLLYVRILKRLSFQWAFTVLILFQAASIGITLIVMENYFEILEFLEKDPTLTGRTLVWPQMIEAINKRPLLGYGFHAFWLSGHPDADIVAPNGWRPPHAHNGFIEIGLDVGWLGLCIFILCFLTTVAQAVKYHIQSDKKQESVLPFVIFAFVVMPNISISRITEPLEMWVIYAMTVVRLSIDTSGTSLSQLKKSRSYPAVRGAENGRSFPPDKGDSS